MHRERFAKIVATIGFVSSSPEMIEKLFLAGVDTFRLNFSHGDHQERKEQIDAIRKIEKKHNKPIAILQDLQGPKFRIGTIGNDEDVPLTSGQQFTFDTNEAAGDNTRVYLPHPEVFSEAKVGDRLLVDDARVCFEITECQKDKLVSKHIYGKKISSKKGVNFPDTVLKVSVLTEKDKVDLKFGLEHGVDYVALSFVQTADDMINLRKLVGDKAHIIAKIEKPSAIDDIENILDASDAIMLARGDLGVEFPPEMLPHLQRATVKKARKAGKPIIVATQMLESMIENPIPTRAEATDISTAILEGADAVMLSGETAAGKYPVKTVEFMSNMITQTEKSKTYAFNMSQTEEYTDVCVSKAIALGLKSIVDFIDIKAIACYTTSGSSARRVSKERGLTPIIALVESSQVARQLQLCWGVDASIANEVTSFTQVVLDATTRIENEGYGVKGDVVAVTAGVPFGKPGTTNTIRLATIGDAE